MAMDKTVNKLKSPNKTIKFARKKHGLGRRKQRGATYLQRYEMT